MSLTESVPIAVAHVAGSPRRPELPTHFRRVDIGVPGLEIQVGVVDVSGFDLSSIPLSITIPQLQETVIRT